jgi:hypothetical protein
VIQHFQGFQMFLALQVVQLLQHYHSVRAVQLIQCFQWHPGVLCFLLIQLNLMGQQVQVVPLVPMDQVDHFHL